ncbi:sn1-specific diacylglycerol lipase alpha-like [Ctenocephalides felis]|uniref:sn1-specific diacylglycerol lipase alpha-like n=2 Tax=Ctenocephalides felis TaxID=7515 RepID=UPI000E6E21DC|nr:sn1-specific diacylglycerol lipase alpha-like [Ctenocephalides felis]
MLLVSRVPISSYLICPLIDFAVIEILMCIVSMRGSILYTEPRNSMPYILYARLGVMFIELGWLGLAISWLVKSFETCPKVDLGKKLLLGLVCSSSTIMLIILATIWCAYDSAGRSWLKMKIYQRSRKDNEQTSRFQYKRSTSNRNWRQRKVLRAYQNSWDSRCKFLFCCVPRSDRVRHNFGDIARLLSEFFRDLDVVPSDVIAGLVLLRKFQKLERDAIVRQRINGTYDFLSGVPINAQTKFLSLDNKSDFVKFQEVIHYMHFAQGAYGWPMFLMTNSVTGLCQLCSAMRCSCMPCASRDSKSNANIIKDNCCECNYAALKRMLTHGEIEVVYATYHVDVGETPFFIAVDYTKRKIVISIRGTLSMKDIITDLNAEGEPLPLNPPKEDWLGHKGMVQAAQYILNELEQDQLLEKAFELNPARGTRDFGLVIVGHSLGAGTAAILAILMQEKYEHLICYSYSPPGGLLSMPAVEHSKKFVTSVVVGKDVVPRIGLHQMEALRADLINAIKRSVDPKWKTIACATMCCCCTSCAPQPTSVSRMRSDDNTIDDYKLEKVSARCNSAHPNDSSIALTLHRPLYPPGKIIHIVRNHSGVIDTTRSASSSSREKTFRAVWCDNADFDEVLISPVMVQDHMPDQVLLALNKVIL